MENTSTELQTLIAKSGLSEQTQQEINAAFEPFMLQSAEWRQKAAGLVVTNVSQVKEMAQAKEARLVLKKIRTGVEGKRKELKEQFLKPGQAIDAIARILTAEIEPIEKHLDEQEKFIEREQEKQKEALRLKRTAELEPLGILTSAFDLANVPEDAYQQLLHNSTLAFNQRKEDEAKAKLEEERLQAIKDAKDARIKQASLLGMTWDGTAFKGYDMKVMDEDFSVDEDSWNALIEGIERKKEYMTLIESRMKSLSDLGMALDTDGWWCIEGLEMCVGDVELRNMDSAAFEVITNDLTEAIKERHRLQQEREKEAQRLKQIENDEKKRLEEEQKEKDRIEKERLQKELDDLQAKENLRIQQENDRLAAIEKEASTGDADKLQALMNELHSISERYSFKSQKNKALFEDVKAMLTNINSHIIAKA